MNRIPLSTSSTDHSPPGQGECPARRSGTRGLIGNVLRSIFLLLTLVSTPQTVYAQHAGAFARMPFGARSTAMGGQVADVSGFASPYHNPALAPFQQGQALELTAGMLTLDRTWQAIQAGAPLRPNAGITAGVFRSAVTDIDGRDDSGYHTGTFSTNELGFFVAFGLNFNEKLTGGIGLRLYRSDLVDDIRPPSAVGVSLGGLYRASDDLAIGLSIDDLFAAYNWNATAAGGGSVTDRFPVRIRGGASYVFTEKLSLSGEVELQAQSEGHRGPGGIDVIGGSIAGRDTTSTLHFSDVQARIGAEYQLAEPFAVRLGVDRVNSDLGAARPGAGFSLRQPLGELLLHIDYAAALEPYGTGVSHLATLRFEL